MELTEQEEFELLKLEREKAIQSSVDATAGQRASALGGGLTRGLTGLAGLPVDTMENLLNLGIAGVGAATKTTPSLIKKSVGGSEWLADIAQKLGINTGVPRPDDPTSRMLHTGGAIVGGMVPFTRRISPTLPSAVAGSVAGETLGPEWVGPLSMAPAAGLQTLRAGRQTMTQNAGQNQASFQEAGAQASVGQATGNAFFRGLENLISKFPGGSGVMGKFSTEQQKALGETTKTGVSTEAAGRAIEQGVTGQGGFLTRTKATWAKLDDAVAAKMPKAIAIPPANTLATLEKLTAPITGAEKTSRVMSTPKVAEIRSAMRSDMAGTPPERVITLLDAEGKPLMQIPIGGTPGKETMPYQGLRELRSKVGSMLDNSLVSGIPTGELKQLYGALSKDMEAAANKAGAGPEFARQNNYYRARMDRVENVLERVIGTGKQPEDIFKTFYPTDPDQANKVRAVMRSLEPAERQIVTDAVVNKLGRVTPGRQDEMGTLFSSETFLTNWNKLSTGAKAQLFPDTKLRLNMDHLAKAAENIRIGSKVFQNTSGTAGSFAAYSVYASPIAAIATGSLSPVVAAGGAAGSAYLGAKLLTSPAVVEWLAKASTIKPGMEAAHLAKLGVIYNKTDDPALKAELTRFMDGASTAIAQQ